jgi:hypothetical protein
MSATREMGSARRRPIPGMVSQATVTDPAPDAIESAESAETGRDRAPSAREEGGHGPGAPERGQGRVSAGGRADRRRESARAPRRRSVDYAATRLVNFRLPVDLHDRFRALVRDAEDRHPRLRKQSLTELVIALLEEGPQTADEVAELIRHKRLDEHEER